MGGSRQTVGASQAPGNRLGDHLGDGLGHGPANGLTRWLLALLTCAAVLVPAAAFAREPIQVPVTVHVATDTSHQAGRDRDRPSHAGGRSVVSEQQIRAALARANAELAAFDVELYILEIVPMRGGARLESQDQRFDLGRRATPDGSIHVFYVDRVKLDNPRKGDRRVSGMHWRYRGFDREVRGREYLAVAHNAPTTTFVHEVGHAFGLAHDPDTDNLMCSCRRGYEPAFTERQGRRLRRGAKRFLRRAHKRAARR